MTFIQIIKKDKELHREIEHFKARVINLECDVIAMKKDIALIKDSLTKTNNQTKE